MDGSDRRNGDHYRVTPEEVQRFHDEGYVHLRGLLSAAELEEIAALYDRFVHQDIPVPGRDYCDMSGTYDRDPATFEIINVMLPRRHWPPLAGNIYERRAASVAAQLQGPGLVLDYDQFLAKPPGKPGGEFPWHQDLAYWPKTQDPRTATSWLALDDSTVENGCLRFVARSHREPHLRPHGPMHGGRDRSHALVARLTSADVVTPAEIARGDVTVHSERVLHGSGPNTSNRWRRAYIVAYRSAETVAAERAMGFTHSHEDQPAALDAITRAPGDENAGRSR